MTTLIDTIKCSLGYHERVRWNDEQCERANIVDGIFAPWWCEHCDAKGQQFPIPAMPMPKVKQPREDK